MSQIRIGDAHGLYRITVGLVDTNGYNFGTAGEGADNGTVMSPYIVKYGQTAEMSIPDRTLVDFTGGNIWTGSYVYGITSLGQFEMRASTVDADLVALTGGSLVDQVTNSRWSVFAENIMLPSPPQCFLMVSFNIQSKQAGSKGSNKHIHMICPRVWIAPKGVAGAPSFQAAGTYGYTVTPTIGERFPWGLLFGEAQNFSENETPSFWLITDNPLHMVGYKADATTAVINLPYKPIAYDYTTPDSDTQPVQVAVNGVLVNADAIDEDNATVTLSGLTVGDYVGVVYETIYEQPTI